MKQQLPFLFLLIFNFGFSQHYVNGNLSTGAVSNSGVTAPTGYTWSELQNNTGDLTTTNIQEYYYIGSIFTFKFADDFVVPQGQIWSLQNFEFYVMGLFSVSSIPVNAVRIQIWDGVPDSPGANVIYGNLTTNVIDLANSGSAMMYSIKNTTFPNSSCTETANTTKKIWKVRGLANATLNAGTYWVLFQMLTPDQSTGNSTCIPGCRYIGSRGTVINSPGRFWDTSPGNSWWNITDPGCPVQTTQLPQDFPFNINYTLLLNNNQLASNSFKLYPNPMKNSFTIDLGNKQLFSEPQTVSIYDIRGLKVYEIKETSLEKTSFNVDVSQLNKGVYFVKLFNGEDVVYTDKIVKE